MKLRTFKNFQACHDLPFYNSVWCFCNVHRKRRGGFEREIKWHIFLHYRVRQCYCHPLYKPFFKHQQKCRTKIPLKILPGIQKSSLKISITKISKNFSVFSVILKILENFRFVIWKYINSQIFSTQYDFNAMSQKKYNFVLSLWFGPHMRGPNGVYHI